MSIRTPLSSHEDDSVPPSSGGPVPRGGMAGWIVAAVVVGLGLLLFLLGEGTPPHLIRGDAAPDFDLPRLDGGERYELGDLRGRISLVNFWATWCKPCEDEIPAMERLYNELHPEGFELVAISADEKREDVASFKDRMKISFPILLDPQGSVARRYQTMGFPESLLLDRAGNIVERYVGPRDWDHPDYVSRIRRLMAGEPGRG